jgi:hypothetical protein
MREVRVHKLDDFQKGKWVLGYTEAPGAVSVIIKEGTVDVPYPAGSLILFNDQGTIAGPVSLEAARSLAERVLEGDQRSSDHKSLLTLAAAVHGFLLPPLDTEAAAAALEPEVAHV